MLYFTIIVSQYSFCIVILQLQANWKIRLQKAWSGSSLEAYCQQVNTCIDISLKCMESDKDKRPNIANVVQQLDENEHEIGKVTNTIILFVLFIKSILWRYNNYRDFKGHQSSTQFIQVWASCSKDNIAMCYVCDRIILYIRIKMNC